MAHITFLIGNGFDLNLGMKTKFTDIYEGYIQTESPDETIKKFKEELKRDRKKGYELWSDFEMRMGEYAAKCESENDFIECIHDFKDYMVMYLKSEEGRVSDDIFKKEVLEDYLNYLEKSVGNCLHGLLFNEQDVIKQAMGYEKNEVRFITFNYTMVLDRLVIMNETLNDSKLFVGIPVHIHGKLSDAVILGVDNITQINPSFNLTRRGQRAFVKPVVNNEYQRATVNAAKEIIQYSDIICIYGMSLGDSDLTWKNEIAAWLSENDNHHLIYNYYDCKYIPKHNIDVMLEMRDRRREELLDKLGLSGEKREKIFEQVHSTVGFNMFDTKDLRLKIQQEEDKRAFITARSQKLSMKERKSS